jgi:error-prone DNA polymerase
MRYVELHARSAFSFLRGASHAEHLADAAANVAMPAMAVCDRDGVYGAPRFFKKAQEAGVRAIVGAELTMEDDSILPVLVETRTGYQNLCRLLTRMHLRSTKGEGRARWEELREFAQGLVALTGDESGPVAHALHSSHKSHPSHTLERLLYIFGPQNLFVEIQRHRLRGEERLNQALIQLAEQYRLPLLTTNGVCYATPAFRAAFDVFTCIRNHTHLDAAGRLLSRNSERHVKGHQQMCELFRDLPAAIENTGRLADRLQFTLENLGYEFPRYPVQPSETMDSVLRQKSFEGARKRFGGTVPGKVRGQLENELALIEKLGVSGYFLIVGDIVEFCRSRNVLAQGRGSAANSSVCFCLGITNVDPLKFHTLFERFLNEGRKNAWPDIDIDLPSGDRRESVIQEVYQRYGKHGAAMTANVITYRGRSAAREIGKALNIPTDVLDRFSSLFANGDFPHTLDLTAQIEKSGLPNQHPRAAAFATLYKQIHGLPRHLGQHSGGMIICQGQLDSIVPLENASMPGRVVAQWDKDDCEELGIIKVDLLGLGMMAVIQDAVELTEKRGHPVDLAQLPENDPKTYEMIQAADTIGVFQIESRAQMATLPRMKPVKFYDLVIEVAIIRPGPIEGGLMHPYLRRRAGKEPVAYYHEKLKPVLARTLGIPLFQEQMLEMAMVMTGFNAAEAEELRRALSFHRSHERMEKVEVKLRVALEKKGYSQKVVEEVAGAVTSFALYGFPESHAISFAHLAYASAYLRAHYMPEFYSSLLNNQPMGFYSPATIVKDGRRHGQRFRPVCIVESDWFCSIGKDNSIRLGLCVVKGLGHQAAKEMLEERAKEPFPSLEDLRRRTRFSRDELRTLAEIGALNRFAKHRRDALWQVEREVQEDLFSNFNFCSRRRKEAEVIDSPKEHSTFNIQRSTPNALRVEDSLNVESSTLKVECFNQVEPPADSPLPMMTPLERTRADYNGTHLTVGPHPMSYLRERCNSLKVWPAADLPKARAGDTIRIAGNVICRQRPGTAKGFVFITLEDETGISNAIVTPPLFEELRLVITEEPYLLIEGRLQNSQNVIVIQARKIERLPTDNLTGSVSHDFR